MNTIKLGKESDNDIVIKDDIVSRHHAVIIIDSGVVKLKDLNSKNGTYVNGKRITSVVVLKPGDDVKLGNHIIDWQSCLTLSDKTKISKSVSLPVDATDVKLIGRDETAHIRFNYDDVSGKHAFLFKNKLGQIVILDNSSTNYTTVNGQIITQKVLQKGDVVLIAKKYSLDWESQYPNPTPLNNLWTKIVIAAAIFVGVVAGGWFIYKNTVNPTPTPEPTAVGPKVMEASEIYDKYKKSVGLIYAVGGFVPIYEGELLGDYLSQLSGQDMSALNILSISENGEVAFGPSSWSGTGFFISNDGKIITNKHVVYPMEKAREAKNITIALQEILDSWGLNSISRRIEVEYSLQFIGIAMNDTYVTSLNDFIECVPLRGENNPDELDVALIQIKTKKTPEDVTAIIDINNIADEESLKLGENVYTIGFPRSFELGTTSIGIQANNQDGKVTQERGEYQYGHNISITNGASGSPVFDKYGRFAGVVNAGFRDHVSGGGTNYNLAIRPDVAAKFANDN
ncbi:MAG: FHA domain-containing protein [Muribaculaceae bacterium]|nr:FHA domain-containing protein [Muribaculaceae bacterium]